MARKPTQTELPPVATDEPIGPAVRNTTTIEPITIDGTMNEVPSDSTALVTGTVPTPGIGDNSANAEYLPSRETIALNLRNDVADFAKHTAAADNVLQRMAFHFRQRHAVLRALNGLDFTLGSLAANTAARSPYYAALLDDMFGAYVDAKNAATSDKMVSHLSREAFVKRCSRAFYLALYLDWREVPMTAFDLDTNRWLVPWHCFVPPGFLAPAELQMLDGKQREAIPIGADDTSNVYYLNRPGNKGQPINLSIRQFNYAVEQQVLTAARPSRVVNEASAERAKRAEKVAAAEGTIASDTRTPAAPGTTQRSAAERAKSEADAAQARADAAKDKATELEQAEADKIAAMTPEELGARTETGDVKRSWWIAQGTQTYHTADKLLAMDEVQAVRWEDLPLAFQNGLVASVAFFDRLKAPSDVLQSINRGEDIVEAASGLNKSA